MLRKLKPNQFVLLTRSGAIGYGVFPFHEWHKKEREDILAEVGLKVEHGEELEMPISKGTYQTVGDKEHAEIIRLYTEENLGITNIAEKLHRSSRTPHVHIRTHNLSVGRNGFCPSCKRVGSPHQSLVVSKGLIIESR